MRHLAWLDKYRQTNHGENIWTDEALQNVALLHREFDACVAFFSGYMSSCYRSVTVNKKVGGASNSSHLYGLAIDVVPNASLSRTMLENARLFFETATLGKYGPVYKVIAEPSWVHVSYHDPLDENIAVISLWEKRGNKYVKHSVAQRRMLVD